MNVIAGGRRPGYVLSSTDSSETDWWLLLGVVFLMPGCCPQGIEKKILPMAHMEEVSMRKAGIICQMHAEATQCSLPRPSAQLRPTSSTQINNPRPLPRPPVSLSHHIRSRLSVPSVFWRLISNCCPSAFTGCFERAATLNGKTQMNTWGCLCV